jgi:hypothetical protein
MFRMFTKTLAMSLTVLGTASALAFAQPHGMNYNAGTNTSAGIASSADTHGSTGAAVSEVSRDTHSYDRSDDAWNNVGPYRDEKVRPYMAPPSSGGSWHVMTQSAAEDWNHVGPYRDDRARQGVANPNPSTMDANQRTMPEMSYIR